MGPGARLVTRVRLRNYKSIALCDVALRPLTFVAGPNGAGKSNFLDGLRFVADALRTTLDHAVRERGGISEVRRRSGGHPTDVAVRLDFELPSGGFGHYAFRVGPREHLAYEIKEEQCAVHGPRALDTASFHVRAGRLVDTGVAPAPAVAKGRLYLVSASGLEPFGPVFDALSRMGFYRLSPEAIGDLQPADPGDLLAGDGSNVASVVERLAADGPGSLERVERFLAEIVPGVCGVEARSVGARQTVDFRQEAAGSSAPWRFAAASMSDGTLRALGILVALFQGRDGGGASLVAVEEPELALHPAAAAALAGAFREASLSRQVIVTTHSPDLLDQARLAEDLVLAAEADGGIARIAPAELGGREALRARLYSVGDLLRRGELGPDESAAAVRDDQMALFDPGPDEEG